MKPSATSGVLPVLVVGLGGCATPFSSPATAPISPPLPPPAGQPARSTRRAPHATLEPGAARRHGAPRRARGEPRDRAARGRVRPGHLRGARVQLDSPYDDERWAAGDRDRTRMDLSQAARLEGFDHQVSACRRGRGSRR